MMALNSIFGCMHEGEGKGTGKALGLKIETGVLTLVLTTTCIWSLNIAGLQNVYIRSLDFGRGVFIFIFLYIFWFC